MIYVDNDFYSNFDNAVKANDDATIQNMMIDQFSTLIAKRRGEVIEMLQKVSVTVTANPTNEELVNKIVSNIRSNKKLQAGMAYLIAKENGILASAQKAAQRTKSEEKDSEEIEGESISTDSTSDTITAISSTIGLLAESLKEERANQFKTDLITQTNTKAPNFSAASQGTPAAKTPEKKKKSKKLLWWGLGIAAVGGLIYYGNKQGWFKGGDKLANANPTPLATPNIASGQPTNIA